MLYSGGLAHLARALAWQARGDRFESGILHDQEENRAFRRGSLFYGKAEARFWHWRKTKKQMR